MVSESTHFTIKNQIQLIVCGEGGGEINANPKDFDPAEPIMHKKILLFTHIKYEQFVCHRKKETHCISTNVVIASKIEFVVGDVCQT